MRYLTNCVHSTAELIDAMQDVATEVTLATFQTHVGLAETKSFEIGQGYADRRSKRGLKMKDDYHVKYYKSVFDGQPCFYIVHSGIEYIYV